MRVGIGYDLHPIEEGRPLVLGGVSIPYPKGLAGHSDADCLVHAICDALLGALGKGDIGERFPDTDERYRGISSLLLLGEVAGLLDRCGYRVNQIDTTIVADAPRITPYKKAMAAAIARTLGIAPDMVSIKATTTNGLILFAREGIAAYAVVSLVPCDAPDAGE
ncbi:MAG: 2-C-methyl-D-erythritol 2,4-cyclodiphosphate synthase [bacterium]